MFEHRARLRPLSAAVSAFAVALLLSAAPRPTAAQIECPDDDCSGDTTPPVVDISPNGFSSTATSLAVTIDWTDETALDGSSYSISLNSNNVNGSFDYSGTNTSAQSSGTIDLAPGDNRLVAVICDTAGNCGSDTETYYREVISVSVTPDGANRTVSGGGWHTHSFTVENTGNSTETYDMFVSCSGAAIVSGSCSASPTSVQLSPGETTTINGTYQATNSGGSTGVLELTAEHSFHQARNTGSYDITVAIQRGVSVTPDGGSAIVDGGSTQTTTFTITNTGNTSATYSTGTTCTGVAANCSASNNSVSLSAGASTTVDVTYTALDDGGATGTVQLTATQTDASTVNDSGYVDITVAVRPPSVSVTPDGATRTLSSGTSTTQDFVVTNTGNTGEHNFQLSVDCTGTGVQSSCSLSTGVVLLPGGASQTVTVSFSTSEIGGTSGTIEVTAVLSTDGSVNDIGTVDIDVPATYGIGVTPDGAAIVVDDGSSPSHAFAVTNSGNTTQTFDLTPGCTGVASGCSVSETSVLLSGGDTATVVVTFDASGSGGEVGTVTLDAVQRGNSSVSDTGLVDVTIRTIHAVDVTPDGETVAVEAGTASTQRFTITNNGNASALYDFTHACTGEITGCTRSVDSDTIGQGATIDVDVNFTAGATAGTQGTIELTATASDDPATRDSGTVTVANAAANAPVVATGDVNTGTTVERGLCLTVAVGLAGASECGDLRLAHGLPTIRTLNRARRLRLLYNSQHAEPHPILRADVTLPANSLAPDTVEAVLTLDGIGTVASDQWDGSAWSIGFTRRIALAFDALSYATGIYPYTLEVTNRYGPTDTRVTQVKGKLAIVNRSQSPYGAGWWPAGLEELFILPGDTILWVGGDGSTREYVPVGTDVWATEQLSRPDTLKKTSVYQRLLPQNGRVEFDLSGKHLATINGRGHRTTLTYDTGTRRLDRIILPLPSQDSSRYYEFLYDASDRLDRIRAVAATEMREASIGYGGATRRIASITGPDTSTVAFAYNGTNRVMARTNRRNVTSAFAYDGSGKVRQAITDVDVLRDTLSVTAAETRGLGSVSVDTASAFTRLDGPRPAGIGDTTRLWIDRFGAPRRIVDALGNETTVSRADAQWPALATRIEEPSGQIRSAQYDPLTGTLQQVVDSSTSIGGVHPVTTYDWHPTCARVTRIQWPEGELTEFGYEPNTCNRTWELSGPDTVFYSYDTGATELLTSVAPPLSDATELRYDGSFAGNLSRVIRPLGDTTTYRQDVWGRDTLTASTIGDGSLSRRRYVYYDAAGRDTLVRVVGPPTSYDAWQAYDQGDVPGDTVIVENVYDDVGNLEEVTRRDGDRLLTLLYTYDRANRKVTEKRPLDLLADSLAYDDAGNLTRVRRRAGGVVTMEYDALNRRVVRVVGPMTYDSIGCSWHAPEYDQPGYICPYRFPLYANNPDGGLTLPADTQTFGYNAAGQITSAKNRYAWVSRTYNPNGTLATDSLRIRSYSDASWDSGGSGGGCPGEICPESVTTLSVTADPYPDASYSLEYGLRFDYDLNGRRIWVEHPTNLAAAGGTGRTEYAYDPAYGRLESVTGPLAHVHGFGYDDENRLSTLSIPGGLAEARTYDPKGRMDWRRRERVGDGVLVAEESIAFSVDDKRRSVTADGMGAGNTYTWTFAHSGLGHLVLSDRQRAGDTLIEEWRYDAFGHTLLRKLKTDAEDRKFDYTYVAEAPDRLEEMFSSDDLNNPNQIKNPDLTRYDYDFGGNTRFTMRRNGRLDPTDAGYDTPTASFHGADGKLMVFQKYGDPSSAVTAGTYDEYWYDALGRRVLRYARTDSLCSAANCHNAVERSVWDGDQILYETRAPTPGASGETSSGAQYGRVAYVHGTGIDQPLALIRMGHPAESDIYIVPHANWRGTFQTGTDEQGAEAAFDIDWPAGDRRAYFDGTTGQLADWFGGLIVGMEDASGLMYRRNRYYDPASGRFTQEDPIGLAGGLDLYGYAGGDPVNFSDPFGLCKIDVRFNPTSGGNHAYIVTAEPDGSERVFRGGPERRGPSSGQSSSAASEGSEDSSNGDDTPGSGRSPWGNIVGGSAEYRPGGVDWNPDAPSVNVVDNDDACTDYHQSFNETLRIITAANIGYSPLTANSNSVANAMLRRAGIPSPEPPVWVPGWNTRLLP